MLDAIVYIVFGGFIIGLILWLYNKITPSNTKFNFSKGYKKALVTTITLVLIALVALFFSQKAANFDWYYGFKELFH